MENYIGFLFLFPVTRKYRHVIDKYFTVLWSKDININQDQFKQLFAVDPRHPKHHIDAKARQNVGDGKMTIFLIVARNTEHVNDYLKKVGRRTIDNLKYAETKVHRKKIPLQNSFHTTDDLEQLNKTKQLLINWNMISDDELATIERFVSIRYEESYVFPNFDADLTEAKKLDQINSHQNHR